MTILTQHHSLHIVLKADVVQLNAYLDLYLLASLHGLEG